METEAEVPEADREREEQERVEQNTEVHIDSREREEQDQILRNLEENFLAKCVEQNLPITLKELRALLPSVDVADLDDKKIKENAELKEAYGSLKRIFAHVDRKGNVKFNQNEFFKLSETKQQHAYAHELGHRLDHLFESSGTEEYAEIQELITGMPADQISLHVFRTAERLSQKEDQTDVAEMIRSEAMAELMAQYLNSDGSFKGFLEYKLTNNIESGEEYWLDNEKSAAMMNEAGQFDDWNADEQLAYFDRHPEMIDHFHIYQNLRSMLNNHELMDSMFEDLEDFEEFDDFDDVYESSSLVQSAPAPTKQASQKQQPPAKEAGKFDFWSIFRLA